MPTGSTTDYLFERRGQIPEALDQLPSATSSTGVATTL